MKKNILLFLAVLIFCSTQPARAGVSLSVQASSTSVDTDPYSLINEVNALRASNGLPAYSINSILMSVAQQHAQYMASNGVTHFGAGGSSPWQRGLAAGYPLAGDLSRGGFYSENITAGLNRSVQEAVVSWQGDAPHLNTMLSPNLREIGAGVAIVGDYVYYVIDCASPTANGQAQVYTPSPGGLAAAGSTAAAAPLLASTIIPVTPQVDGKIIHIVKPGETLWLIAISYGVKIVDLRRLNNLAETQSIYPGEKLFVKQDVTALPPHPTSSETIEPSASAAPSSTRSVTSSPSPTSNSPPAAPVSSNSSKLALAAIIAAAVILAVVFVKSGRKS